MLFHFSPPLWEKEEINGKNQLLNYNILHIFFKYDKIILKRQINKMQSAKKDSHTTLDCLFDYIFTFYLIIR